MRTVMQSLSPAPRVPRPDRFKRALAAGRIVHPFPTLLCVAATALLAVVAVQGLPGVSQLWRMLIVMLLVQSAIGVTNDLADRDLERFDTQGLPIEEFHHDLGGGGGHDDALPRPRGPPRRRSDKR